MNYLKKKTLILFSVVCMFCVFSPVHASPTQLYAVIINGRTSHPAHNNGQKRMESICLNNRMATFAGGYRLRFDSDNGSNMTKKTFLDCISGSLKSAGKNDIAYFCYTGHGSKTDFYIGRNKRCPTYKEVAKKLAESKCKKIYCVVNACHNVKTSCKVIVR